MILRPNGHRYARIERERRFRLDALPPGVDPQAYERLRDCYLSGTHLRLRRVETPRGERVTVKLGQKAADPAAPADPRRRLMTTLYLPPGEEAAFESLPGVRSSKRRYRLDEQGFTFVIDVYEAPAAAVGTRVAEVECPTDAELDAIELPIWAVEEVTAVPGWSGFELASR